MDPAGRWPSALTRLPPHTRDLASTPLQLERSRRTCHPGQVKHHRLGARAPLADRPDNNHQPSRHRAPPLREDPPPRQEPRSANGPTRTRQLTESHPDGCRSTQPSPQGKPGSSAASCPEGPQDTQNRMPKKGAAHAARADPYLFSAPEVQRRNRYLVALADNFSFPYAIENILSALSIFSSLSRPYLLSRRLLLSPRFVVRLTSCRHFYLYQINGNHFEDPDPADTYALTKPTEFRFSFEISSEIFSPTSHPDILSRRLLSSSRFFVRDNLPTLRPSGTSDSSRNPHRGSAIILLRHRYFHRYFPNSRLAFPAFPLVTSRVNLALLG